MKIGIVTTYFYPFLGGAESNAYYLAKELSKEHEVHIFTSDRKNSHIIEKKEEKIGNIQIHRSKTWFRYKYYLAFYPSLVTNLLKYDLDIIHVHSLGFIWHDFCILIKRLFSPKTKFIITPHGPFMALKKYPFWQETLKKIITLSIKITNRVYDRVIQVNPTQYTWLTKEYKLNKEKIVYLPNGIDKSIFKKSNTSNFVKKYNLENKFIVSYIGRLMEYKGIHHVIQVLLEVVKKRKNLVFVVIGQDAGYYKKLESLVKNLKLETHVRFLINLNDQEKEKILELSEIFIMPSEWEAFGISILEAMAKGNAIISTKTEGGNFLIEKNNGLLYNFGDTKALGKNLLELIKNNKLRASMQKNNLEKVKEFTWDKIAKNLEEEYKKCFQ